LTSSRKKKEVMKKIKTAEMFFLDDEIEMVFDKIGRTGGD